MRAHFEDSAAAGSARLGRPEAGVEEAGEMHPELADESVIGNHLGGMVGRHHDRLACRQDIEIVGVEHDALGLPPGPMELDRLPEIERVVMVDAVDIDDIGMTARLPADDSVRRLARQVDGKGQPVADRLRPGHAARGRIDEAHLGVQPAQGRVAEQGRAAADAQLHQARAGARQDAEGTRRDLGIERAAVALADAVEFGALVGNDPGEHIEPADRALRVGEGRDPLAQGEVFEQWHDIDAVLFQDRAPAQIDLVHREPLELVAHAGPRPRQKARPHPVGDLA